jgi:hypothetical protein
VHLITTDTSRTLYVTPSCYISWRKIVEEWITDIGASQFVNRDACTKQWYYQHGINWLYVGNTLSRELEHQCALIIHKIIEEE